MTLQRIRCCETIVLKTEISEEAAKGQCDARYCSPLWKMRSSTDKENVPLTIRLKAWVGRTLYISIIDDARDLTKKKAGEDGVPKSSKMSGTACTM